MGVLKNDVGRPSNKEIKIRNILKTIIFVVIIGILFFVGYLLIKDTNKNRYIYLGNFDCGNYSNSVVIDEKYNTVSLISEEKINNAKEIPNYFNAEKYNNKVIKIKYAFLFNPYMEDYFNPKLYIITEENEILLIKDRNISINNNCSYKIVKYKDSKVKHVEILKGTHATTVNIDYEDGTYEEIEAIYTHKTK